MGGTRLLLLSLDRSARTLLGIIGTTNGLVDGKRVIGRATAPLYGSNLPLADRLQGKLLFVMPTDDNAFASTVRMIDALIQAGKPYDLLLVPGTAHSYVGARGRMAGDHVWNRMIPAYLVEHLIENPGLHRQAPSMQGVGHR